MFVTDFLLPVLTGVASFAFSIMILSRFLYVKESYRPVNILLAAIGASVAMAFINTLWISYVNLLSVYVIFTVITHIFFKGNFALRFGFAIIIMTINALSEHLVPLLILIFTGQWKGGINGTGLYYNLIGIMTLGITIALALTISKVFPRKYQVLDWRGWFMISYQLIAVGASTLIMEFTEASHVSFAASLFVVLFYIALLLFSILIFFVSDGALHKQELENQIELYQYQFEQMKNSQAVIGRIEHDIEKHLLALKLDLNNAQPREAEQKIDALIGNLRLSKSVADSGNADVDAIINYKATHAEEYGIRIVCDLHLPYTLNMNTTDLSIILGNAIDNAIEACKTVEPAEREISLMINYEKTNLRMAVSNPFVGELKIDAAGELRTAKIKGRHGIGLGSIRETVEKYDGLMDISTEDNRFILKILLFNLQSQ